MHGSHDAEISGPRKEPRGGYVCGTERRGLKASLRPALIIVFARRVMRDSLIWKLFVGDRREIYTRDTRRFRRNADDGCRNARFIHSRPRCISMRDVIGKEKFEMLR